MKVLNFVKFIALSVVALHIHLFADTYKPEVTKDGKTIKFCVHSLTDGSVDWFAVRRIGNSYESGDWSVGGCMEGITVGTGVTFDFGAFHASFDDKNNQLYLSNGSFDDTLLLTKTDCSFAVAGTTELKAHTLVVKDAKAFKNEGSLEAFITILQDCPTVENKGKFHARNLFLYGTDIQNYGVVSWNDAFKPVNGKIVPKAPNPCIPEKKGFIKTERPTGNTVALTEINEIYDDEVIVSDGCIGFKGLQYYVGQKKRSYTLVLIGYLSACGKVMVESGVTFNLGVPGSDSSSCGTGSLSEHGDITFKSGVINACGSSGGSFAGFRRGVWVSQCNGQKTLRPDFDRIRNYKAYKKEALHLYIIYDDPNGNGK